MPDGTARVLRSLGCDEPVAVNDIVEAGRATCGQNSRR